MIRPLNLCTCVVLILAASHARAAEPPECPRFPFDASAAHRYQREYAKRSSMPLEIHNAVGMAFVLIPPGEFLMGSPAEEPGHRQSAYDETQHPVRLSRAFYLARHETTVGLFRSFVEAAEYATDGERHGGGHAHDERAVWKRRQGVSWRKPGFTGPYELQDSHPAVQVSHCDAMAFCRWLQETAPVLPSRARRVLKYDLPTEAQWEWACRAGSGARYWWGEEEDITGKLINAGDRTLKRLQPEWPRAIMPMDDGHAFPAPVGSYQPNAFGLYDMLGNVWEVCSTRYGTFPQTLVVDPGDLDPLRGFAVRGGGWSNEPRNARCASRNADPPHFCHSNLGFRVAIQISLRVAR